MSIFLLFDTSFFNSVMMMMAPLTFACLGEILIERSGILNLGIEGMLMVGAVLGFLGTYQTGSATLGCLSAMAGGSLLTLMLAYFAISLRGSQVIVGLSIFVLGLGLSPLLYRLMIGVVASTPQVPTLPYLEVPFLGNIPFIGEAFFRQNILVYTSYVLVVIMGLFLFKTPLGLRIRACGENPRAVDTLGISVTRLRYGSCAVGGMLLGLSGAYLPLVITGTFTNNIINGRGWIALILVIFGRWVPLWSFLGAFLFACVDAFQFRVSSLPGMSKIIPPQFLLMLPYLFALLVIIKVARGTEAPQSLARPYDREARGLRK